MAWVFGVRRYISLSLSLSLSLSPSPLVLNITDKRFYPYRFFSELAKPVHRYLKLIWIIMWKLVGPIVMFIIFFASIILQLVDPLSYSVFHSVSYLMHLHVFLMNA